MRLAIRMRGLATFRMRALRLLIALSMVISMFIRFIMFIIKFIIMSLIMIIRVMSSRRLEGLGRVRIHTLILAEAINAPRCIDYAIRGEG